MARTAACTRSRTPSFSSMWRTCLFTVLTLMKSFRAICWLVSPIATSLKISISRGVRGSEDSRSSFVPEDPSEAQA
jgi:hypothetical protein